MEHEWYRLGIMMAYWILHDRGAKLCVRVSVPVVNSIGVSIEELCSIERNEGRENILYEGI